MATHRTLRLIGISILLLAILRPVGAYTQPMPGELLVKNDLAVVGGTCEGSVSITYGVMPQQRIRQFSTSVDPDCSIVVKAANQIGNPVWFFGSTVCADMTGWIEDPIWRGYAIITQEDCYRYPLVNCIGPPALDFWQGAPQHPHDQWWSLVSDYTWHPDACSTAHEANWARTNNAITASLRSLAGPAFVGCEGSASTSIDVDCTPAETPTLGPFNTPAIISAAIPPGSGGVFVVGSGM